MEAHTGGQSPRKWRVFLKSTLGDSDPGRIKQGERTLGKKNLVQLRVEGT